VLGPKGFTECECVARVHEVEVFFWIPPRSEKTLLGHTLRNPTDEIKCGKYLGTEAQCWAWDGDLVRKNHTTRATRAARHISSLTVGLRAVSRLITHHDNVMQVEMEAGLPASDLTELLTQLVRGNVNRHYPQQGNKTALHLAARTRNMTCCHMLVDGGADVNVEDSQGFTPLHCAADVDSEPVIRYLVEKGADLNAKTGAGATPLIVASSQERMHALSTLVELGADMEARDAEGSTALHLAAMRGAVAVVSKLAEKGAAFKTSTHDEHCTGMLMVPPSEGLSLEDRQRRADHSQRAVGAALHMLAFRGRTYGPPGCANHTEMAQALLSLGIHPNIKLAPPPGVLCTAPTPEEPIKLVSSSIQIPGFGLLELEIVNQPTALLGSFSPLEIARARNDSALVRLLERAEPAGH
jgi:ankyrin repeat protein